MNTSRPFPQTTLLARWLAVADRLGHGSGSWILVLRMTWILVGYFPKRRTRLFPPWRPPYLNYPDAGFPVSAPVEEICSISDCVAPGPVGWREQEKHNFYEMYDNPALAWSVVSAEVRTDFELFAYRLHLVQFEEGREEPIEERWELAVEPMGDSFVRLGWDAVEGGNHCGFGCSPLSCNTRAGERGIPAVNRFCLVDTEQDAIELARGFSISKPEPGPYCVVEVWRDVGSVAEPGTGPVFNLPQFNQRA